MDLKVIWPWEHDLQTYIPSKGEKLTSTKIKHHDELQKKTPKVVVDFFNPLENKCPHTILCSYYGDTVTKPASCCEKCEPQGLEDDLSLVTKYTKIRGLGRAKQKMQIGRLPGQSFPELSKDLQETAHKILWNWRHDIWRQRDYLQTMATDVSPEITVSDGDLRDLGNRIHIVSTKQQFDALLKYWVSVRPLMEEEQEDLWSKVQQINRELHTVLKWQKATMKQHSKSKVNAKVDGDDQLKSDWSVNEVMWAEMHSSGGMGGKACDAASETQGSLSVDKVTGVGNVLHGKWSRVCTERGMLYDEQLWEEEGRKELHKQNKK